MGVLERVADPEDARARRVVLTKAGRDGIFEGLAVLRGLEKELEQSVGATPMLHLRRALLSIQGSLPPR
jgi:DNA-binding MarR family transcriptional regulator